MRLHHFLILAALPLMASEAAAQNVSRYRNWDTNNDGMISRAEWRGTLERFRDLDWNNDGMLSMSELGDRERQPAESWDAMTFMRLDRNSDGRITRGEWQGDRLMFQQVDRNRDNQITRGEFMNSAVGYNEDVDDRADFYALDADGNGRVDRFEWNGTRAMFNRLDLNRDGTLSARELGDNDAVIARGVERNTIQIDGREPWIDTGIHVNAGDIVTYRADGVIQMSTNENDRATPAGSLTGRTARNSPRPDLKAGLLLMRIGNVTLGASGDSGSFTVPANGQLHLGINDDHFGDNTGQYRVTLTVQPRY